MTPPRPKSGLAPAMIVAGVLLLVMAVYVLGIGPMYKLVYEGSVSTETFDAVYKPLLWIKYRVPAVERAIDQYANWWKPPFPRYQPGETGYGPVAK